MKPVKVLTAFRKLIREAEDDLSFDKLEMVDLKQILKFIFNHPQQMALVFLNNMKKYSATIEEKMKDIFDEDITKSFLQAIEKWAKIQTDSDEANQLITLLPTSILNDLIFDNGLKKLEESNDEKNDSSKKDDSSLFNLLIKCANQCDSEVKLPHSALFRWVKDQIIRLLSEEKASENESASKSTNDLRQNKNFIKMLSYIIDVAKCCDLSERVIPSELLSTTKNDNELDSKLCTYTTTRRDFQNQHWYHCYTCEMYDSVGICSICALVCHRGHSMSYAKFSSFFCDCGAENDEREVGMCQALQPRTSNSKSTLNESAKCCSTKVKINQNLDKQLCTDMAITLGDVFENWIKKNLKKNSVSSKEKDQGHRKADELLSDYRTNKKSVVYNSYVRAEFQTNEGALTNVKPSFGGDTAIRKILTENVTQRKYIGLVTHNQEIYLIILHDKSRLSLLGLSSLLSKKSRSSQMAVSKQSSTNLAIPVTSLAVSHCSENIAVCSLRDVTIVMIRNGSFGRQFSLNLNFSSSCFITSIVWAPNSPTILAVVSNKNIKIYDFSKDIISPIYNFKVIVGSFVDATFLFRNGKLHLLALTNEGAIFVQVLDERCEAEKHGEVYLGEF